MKKIFVILCCVVVLLSSVSIGYCHTYLRIFTEEERKSEFEQADLVFDGSFVDTKHLFSGKTEVNAVAHNPASYESQQKMTRDLPFLIIFNVDKVIKGEYSKKTYTILIHSPSTQFGIGFMDKELSLGKKFRIYLEDTPNGEVLIGQEALPLGTDK